MSGRIVTGVREGDYLRSPQVSASDLKAILKSPAHYRHEKANPRPSTEAMEWGSVVHRLVLGTGSDVVVVDATSWRTKAAIAARDEARAAGAAPILRADLREASRAARRVRCHPVLGELFDEGAAEETVYWTDEETGLECRCRVDWLNPGAVIDLKTARDASPRGFAKAVVDLRYDLSAAWYVDGVAAATGEHLPYVWVAVEKEGPLEVAAYYATPDLLDRGRRLYREALTTLAACLATDAWPGYADDIQPLQLPRWAA